MAGTINLGGGVSKPVLVHRSVRIGIIMDGSLSFAMVYPKVYGLLEKVVNRLSEHKAVDIRYGLTIARESAETMIFPGGASFTGRGETLLKQLQNLEFYGGAADGCEDIEGAIHRQLRALCEPEEEASLGLLLFTDSLPRVLTPDFLGKEQDGYRNRGLSFADVYAYSDDFLPRLRIVDQQGRLTENSVNQVFCHDLHELLDMDRDELDEYSEVLADAYAAALALK